MRFKFSKIALCLPLLFLDIEQVPQNTADLDPMKTESYISTGWGWRLTFNTADADQSPGDCDRNPQCTRYEFHHTPSRRFEPNWPNHYYDDQRHDDYDGGGGDGGGTTQPTQPSLDDEPWTTLDVTKATKFFSDLKIALAEQLKTQGLDPKLAKELTKAKVNVRLILEVLQGGGEITNNILNNKLGYASADLAAVLAGIGVPIVLGVKAIPAVFIGLAVGYAVGKVGYAVADHVQRRIEQLESDHNWNRQCAEWRSYDCHLQRIP